MRIRSFALCFLVALTACATSPSNRYYVLAPSPEAEAALDKARVAAAPQVSVSVPAYLDRAQIVVQKGDGQVDIREFDRWAEPVDGMIRRVLLQDMSAGTAPRAAVVTIDSFVFAEDTVTLRAHWTVTTASSSAAPPTHYFAQRAAASGGIGASVNAMSGLVASLAQEIAASAR